MPRVMSSTKLKFGDFELDVAGYELSRSGRPIRLERIPMELLLLLVERRGQLVARNEILEKLWGKEVFLDVDNSINTAVSKIRVALKDDPENPAFIRTISGKGYRFIAAVATLPDGEIAPSPSSAPPKDSLLLTRTPSEGTSTDALERLSNDGHPIAQPGMAASNEAQTQSDTQSLLKPGRWWLWPSLAAVTFVAAVAGWSSRDSLRRIVSPNRGPVIRSLAVLPLENLTGDPSQEYFADGMTDALITDLAQIGTLRVISRTSIMRYKGIRKPLPDIARELGVDGIVEGTVTRSTGRVRVTSQLIYAPGDQHLWAHSYERDPGDVLKLQSEVAQAIAQQVRAQLTPQQKAQLGSARMVSPEAYEAYLKGRFFWNKYTEEGMKESIKYYRQAIQKDPQYAEAFAGLSASYGVLGNFSALPPYEAYPEAKAAATKAVELDDRVTDGHSQLGYMAMFYDHDWPRAEREFGRALELNPSSADAHRGFAQYLLSTGRIDESIANIRKAKALDPVALDINFDEGWYLYMARRPDEAIAQLRRVLDMDPNFVVAHLVLGGAYEEKGEFDQSIGEYKIAVALSGNLTGRLGALGHAYAVAGRTKEARETLIRIKQVSTHRYVSPYHTALVYAGLGEQDEAFALLEKAYREHFWMMAFLNVDPRLDPLRSDPRFQDLQRREGLSP